MNKKILFKFNVDNAIDIITNSSSELFVLKADSNKIVVELLESVYPDFRKEYDEPIQFKDMDAEQFTDCIHWLYGYSEVKEKCASFPGFTFEQMYVKSEHSWREEEYNWKEGFLEENQEAIIKAIDPLNKQWFLYSKDENPNWDMQEKLMEIGDRYHLG